MMRKQAVYFLTCSLLTSFTIQAKELFTIQGSNTIGSELAPALVKGYLQETYNATNVRYISNKTEEGIVRGFDPSSGLPIDVVIYSHGSSTGFSALKANQTDIAMSSRPIKDKEVASLSVFGDLKSFTSENIIGLDGIAVIVHRDNPITALPRTMLTQIFSGRVKTWDQVDSRLIETPLKNQPIAVYARDNNSGTYDTFKKLVLNKSHLTNSAKRYESNAHLSDDVADNPYAIGFVGLPYIRNSKAIAVSEGSGKPRAPSNLTVATEDYSLTRRLFMYIPEHGVKPEVSAFINYVQNETGQALVDRTGFVSQNIYASDISVPDIYPSEYKDLTRNAKRLSVNIYFENGSLQPDNRAKRDLKRIADYINQKKVQEVMLFGFSEDNDFPLFNVSLSESRADFVERLLKREGVTVNRIRGYGAVNPVADNDAIVKNRRVEVWIR